MSLSLTNYTYQEPEERSFVLLPKGRYPFRILEFNSVEQSRSGNPMIPVKLEVGHDGEPKAVVYENLVFIESAVWKINQFLKALFGGIKPGRQVNFEDPNFLDWLKARAGEVEIDQEPVKGKDYLRNCVKSFVTEKTAVSGTTVTAPPAKEPPPSPAPAPDDDDDCPF